MDYDAERKEITSGKIINELDNFAIHFVKILEKYSDYVIVSGYVSIILGRARASEDIDLLVPKISITDFKKLFSELINRDYECANSMNSDEAYEMLSEHAIRFFKRGKPLPNIEFKFMSTELQNDAFKGRIKIVLSNAHLFISPLELQIAYKLSLMSDYDTREMSSDKDFEDAKHIYEIFKGKIDKDKLLYYANKLNVLKRIKFLQDA